jgi:hypothetical protein
MEPLTPEQSLMNLKDRSAEVFMSAIEKYLPPECTRPVTNIRDLSWALRERTIQQYQQDGWYRAATYYLSGGITAVDYSSSHVWQWLASKATEKDWIIIGCLLEMWRPKYDDVGTNEC